jgi:integrase
VSGKHEIAFFEGNSWYHRVKLLQPDGTVKYSKRGGFATAPEAEKSYREYEENFKSAYRAYYLKSGTTTEIGLRDYLIFWFEDNFSERVENTTRMVGAYTLYDLILPCMEQDIKLRYVNVEYLDSLLKIVSKACVSAGNKSRELLNIALKEAVVQGFLKTNPVPGTKPYKRPKPSITILSKESIKRLLSAASKGEWYLEILLALFCGLRKGEIQGLKFSDFDMENKTVFIQRQITSNPIIPRGERKIVSYEVAERAPKTDNSYRVLRVPEVVMQELEQRRSSVESNKAKLQEDYIDRDYISCQENGLPHSVTAFNNALTKLCKRNGLPHVTVHGLRHMYATILVEQGVPLVKISALLGHASVHTTFEYYCDVMDENEQIISFMNSNFIPEGGD